MKNELNFHQQKSALIKEINFLFQHPSLTVECRSKVCDELKEIRDKLKLILLDQTS